MLKNKNPKFLFLRYFESDWAKVAEYHDPEAAQRTKIDRFIQSVVKILERWNATEVINGENGNNSRALPKSTLCTNSKWFGTSEVSQ